MTRYILSQSCGAVPTRGITALQAGSAHDVKEFALDEGVCKLRQVPLANLHDDGNRQLQLRPTVGLHAGSSRWFVQITDSLTGREMPAARERWLTAAYRPCLWLAAEVVSTAIEVCGVGCEVGVEPLQEAVRSAPTCIMMGFDAA